MAEKIGFLICNNCLATKPPGERFKVLADDAGLEKMLEHVKHCTPASE